MKRRELRIERRELRIERRELFVERGGRIGSHGRLDRHARAERDVGRRIVEDDLDRHALDDLDVIAGGVLRRQQREGGARSGLHARDMALEWRSG